MSHRHHSPVRRIGRADGHHVHLPAPRQQQALRPGCRDRKSQTTGNRYSVTCFSFQAAVRIPTRRDGASIDIRQPSSAFTEAGPRRDRPAFTLPRVQESSSETIRTKMGSTGKGVKLRRWSPGALTTMTEASTPNRAVDAHV